MEITGVKPIRECTICGFKSDDLNLFIKDSGSRYGRRNQCKECRNKINRTNTKAPEYKHKHQLAKRYKTTPEKYVECMNTSSSCEICGSTDSLCYDHDHDTMKFRGVLCRGCNRSIGQLGDTKEALQKALNYLSKDTH